MTNRPFKCTALSAVMLLAMLLSGCGSLRLYSEVRDKQGIAAKEAWGTVDLAAVISTERTNLKKLLEAELDTQDHLASGIRNHELRALVEAKTLKEGLVDPVNARLLKVAGSVASVSASRDRLRNYRTNLVKFEVVEEELKAKRLAMPSCAEVSNGAVPAVIEQWFKSADDVSISEVNGTLGQLRKICKSADGDIFVAVYAGLEGEIGRAIEQYHSDTASLNAIRSRAEKLRAGYKEALAAYTAAVAAAKGRSDAAEQVKPALGKLKDAVSVLESAQDALSVQFLSKERLDSLDKFVDAVTQSTTGGQIPEGASEATVAFILLPGLVDDARQSLAAARKPLALPMLIRRNHEQLKLEAATREIEAREAMVRLSKALVEALYEQAIQLWQVSTVLGQDGTGGSPNVLKLHSSSMADAFSKTGSNEKEALLNAAARYLDAVNRLSARRYKLEYMRIAATHELSLVYAEVNLKQWESLIGTTVDQVASASAGGIKAENVSALLNTAGVLWIGHGVNK